MLPQVDYVIWTMRYNRQLSVDDINMNRHTAKARTLVCCCQTCVKKAK